jgi:hypothetical protein
MLSHSADPLAIAHKAELGWDKTLAAMIEQYGRKLWLEVMRTSLSGELNEDEVMSCILLLCANKLKKGDDALLASAVPKGAKRAAREAYRLHTNAAATAMEKSDWSLK